MMKTFSRLGLLMAGISTVAVVHANQNLANTVELPTYLVKRATTRTIDADTELAYRSYFLVSPAKEVIVKQFQGKDYHLVYLPVKSESRSEDDNNGVPVINYDEFELLITAEGRLLINSKTSFCGHLSYRSEQVPVDAPLLPSLTATIAV